MDHNKLWKILKEIGVPDYLSCFLRNLYLGQEATVRTGHGTMDWFKIGKGVQQGYILSPSLLDFYAEYIMRNTGLEEAQAGIKIARRVKVKVAQLCLTHCDPMDLYTPWNSPGHNIGVGSLSLLQGIVPTQGLNPCLPHCRQILYQLSHRGSAK